MSARLMRLIGLCALALLLAGPAAWADSAAPPRQGILLLYAYGYGGRGVELFSEGFFKAITEAGFPVGNVYAEYLDLQRNKDLPGYRAELLDVLRKKYAHRRIDLIVTLQQPALEFLLGEGREIAPQAPVITIQHRPLLEAEKAGRRIVGEINQFDIKGTLERALELFPDTRRVVFASGSSAADRKVAEEAARIAAGRKDLEFEYTTDMALDAILRRVANLPPNSIVIFTQYNVDSAGRVALAYEAERMIVKAANAPVFGFYDFNLRNGGIGGSVIGVEASGARLGTLALGILKGEGAGQAGTLRVNESVPMFDWRQIERWGGDAGRLPANAVFVNRPPSAWQQYGAFIGAALLLIVVQSALIAALVGNMRRRRRAEGVLAESEANFRAIFDGMLDAAVFADPTRHIRLVNAAFTRMFGYTADEVAGRSTEFLYADPADYADQGSRRFHGGAGGESGAYEMRYRHKDGSEFWAESSGMRILGPDGRLLGLMGLHRDIAGRKRAEHAQREAEVAKLEEQKRARLAALNQMEDANAARHEAEAVKANLEAALAAMSDAVFISDASGRFIHINDACAKYHRLRSKAECVKTFAEYPKIIEVFLPDGEPAPIEMWAVPRALRGETANDQEYTLRRKDSNETWIGSYNLAPVRNERGEIVGSVVTARDVTERKRIETEIQRLNADLERRVVERTAELTAANRELDAFAYAVSHDLRAPLRAMSGFSQALVEDYGGRLDGDALAYLDQIGVAARKMGELIDGILALSRSTRGELEREPVDLSALATRRLEELARGEPRRAVAWQVESGLMVTGDARMVEAALGNLLDNAWKYSAKTAAARIRVYAEEADGRRWFCVEDNGAGFDMAHAERLFKPFQRLHRQDEFPGIGIGLATVQRIVHRHGGEILAEGRPGAGATFRFALAANYNREAS